MHCGHRFHRQPTDSPRVNFSKGFCQASLSFSRTQQQNVVSHIGGPRAVSNRLPYNVLILFRSTVQPKIQPHVTKKWITSWKCCDIPGRFFELNWMKTMFMSTLEKTVLPFISSNTSSTVGMDNFSLWIASFARLILFCCDTHPKPWVSNCCLFFVSVVRNL